MDGRALLWLVVLLAGCVAPRGGLGGSLGAPRPAGHEGEAIGLGLLFLVLAGVVLVCALVDVLLLPVFFAADRDDDLLFPCCRALFSLF